MAAADAHLDALGVAGAAGQPEPEHVHRRAELLRSQAEFAADGRVPAVRGDGERRADLDPLAAGADRDHAADGTVGADQLDHLVLAQQGEAVVPLRLAGEQFEEVPLGQEHQVRVPAAQAAEVGDVTVRSAKVNRRCRTIAVGQVGEPSSSPSSSMMSRVDGCTVSPRMVGLQFARQGLDRPPSRAFGHQHQRGRMVEEIDHRGGGGRLDLEPRRDQRRFERAASLRSP